ncbi:MAG: STAS domain-containing protein [Candidatus Komeilibacteria bacterium]
MMIRLDIYPRGRIYPAPFLLVIYLILTDINKSIMLSHYPWFFTFYFRSEEGVDMSCTVTRRGPLAILRPEGTLWGSEEIAALRRTLDELIASNNVELVIDLGQINHLNATALGLLVFADANYKRRGGKAVVCNVERRLNNIFVITKLSLVFEVYRNLDEAIVSFSAESRRG